MTAKRSPLTELAIRVLKLVDTVEDWVRRHDQRAKLNAAHFAECIHCGEFVSGSIALGFKHAESGLIECEGIAYLGGAAPRSLFPKKRRAR